MFLILQSFSATSGQQINFSKSHVIFGKKAPQHFKDHVCSTLNMPNLGEYLGIPFSHSKNQIHLYKSLIQKLQFRAYSWRQTPSLK